MSCDQDHRPDAFIKVVGIGGLGRCAIERLLSMKISGVECIAMDADIHELRRSCCAHKIALGPETAKGRSPGRNALLGRQSAQESREAIAGALSGARIAFLAAGMGGNIGMGAIPTVAEIAGEMGILTVSVATTPFDFEGKRKLMAAEQGIKDLLDATDCLVVVPSSSVENTEDREFTLQRSFEAVEIALCQRLRSLIELVRPGGVVSFDFADMRQILKGAGLSRLAVADVKGRGEQAVVSAIEGLRLESGLSGERSILLHFEAPRDVTLHDVDAAIAAIRKAAQRADEIVWSACIDDTLADEMRIAVLITGFDIAASKDY